jgi:hypothetical protein
VDSAAGSGNKPRRAARPALKGYFRH